MRSKIRSKTADFYAKYRDTNLQIALNTYNRVLFIRVFYRPATSGSTVENEAKYHEIALESNKKYFD